jgi:transcription elongation factor GreA
MTQKEVLVTKEGLEKWEEELQNLLTVRRPEVADKIKRAREMGGTENNAEYEDAKNEQAFVEGRILEVEQQIRQAKIIKTSRKPTGKVVLGSTVLIKNQDGKVEFYQIVGKSEADPVNGKISNESPVGKALLGHKVGQTVEVIIPAGKLKLQIQQVS